jgi:hypothetical protein
MKTWEVTHCHLKNKGQRLKAHQSGSKMTNVVFISCQFCDVKKNNRNFKAITIILKTNSLQIQEGHQLKFLFTTNVPKKKLN